MSELGLANEVDETELLICRDYFLEYWSPDKEESSALYQSPYKLSVDIQIANVLPCYRRWFKEGNTLGMQVRWRATGMKIVQQFFGEHSLYVVIKDKRPINEFTLCNWEQS